MHCPRAYTCVSQVSCLLFRFLVSVQVLAGDTEEAICSHAFFYSIWRKYGALPERYNWQMKAPDVLFYPLRPELVESTYFLYRATRNPFYLHVGRDILKSLSTHAKAEWVTLSIMLGITHRDLWERGAGTLTNRWRRMFDCSADSMNQHLWTFAYIVLYTFYRCKFTFSSVKWTNLQVWLRNSAWCQHQRAWRQDGELLPQRDL